MTYISLLNAIKIGCQIFLFTLFFTIVSQQEKSPRLLIKFPTRERVERFFTCLDLYYKNLSNKYFYNFLITCDEDDNTMNNPVIWERFKKYPNLKVIYGKSSSKIDACNRDMEHAPEFDILILPSDDMNPVVEGYDEIIVAAMLKNFPDFDGIIKFKDNENNNSILNTLPIMGVKYYKRFGYIYHPSYSSFFCDLEMTFVSKILNKEAIIDRVIIRHDNPMCSPTPVDELFKRNLKYLNVDKEVFLERYKVKFDLSEIKSHDAVWIAAIINNL